MAKFHNDSKSLRDDTPPPGRLGLPPSTPRKRTETTIQGEIIAALNALPGVRVARNTVGRLRDRNGAWVTYGLGVGSPDMVGIYTHRSGHALAFGVEVKTATGRVREEQALWHQAMARRGLPTFVARSPEEARTQVETWCAEVDGAL